MSPSKKRVSIENYIDLLLEVRLAVEDRLLVEFSQAFDYEGEPKKLKYEARILSLWLLCLGHTSKDLLDRIHDTFCEYLGASQEMRDVFYQDVDQRYSNYFAAFSVWQTNPQSGLVLGSAIVETVKNQNPHFSLEEGSIPIVGATEAFIGFMLFESSFTFLLKSIEEINEKHTVVGL